MKKEQLEQWIREAEEGLCDIENVLQMLEVFLELNEEEEAVQRSVRLIRKMICGVPKRALYACRISLEDVQDG